MNKTKQSIIDSVLSEEGYVEFPPDIQNTFEFKLAFLIKNEIRSHKWNLGTQKKSLTWDQAREDWMRKYYKDFLAYFNKLFKGKKIRKKIKITNNFERREPVIKGFFI